MDFFDPDEQAPAEQLAAPSVAAPSVAAPSVAAPPIQGVGQTVAVADNFGVMGAPQGAPQDAQQQFVDPDQPGQPQKEYASTNPADEPQFAGHQKKSLREMMLERPNLLLDTRGTYIERLAAQNAKDQEVNAEIKRLWSDESMIGHTAHAYQKGVFDKPIGELVKSGKEFVGKKVDDFSLQKLMEFAVNKPGKFSDALVDSVAADPWMVLPFFWEALGGRVGAIGLRLGGEVSQAAAKIGQATGSALEVGATGALVGGGMSAAKQLDEQGFINPSDLMDEMKIGAAMAAGMSVIGSVAGAITRFKPKEIMPSVDYHMQEGDDVMTAMAKAMEEHGVPKAKADELSSALKRTGDRDSDKNFLALRKKVQAMLPPPKKAVAAMTPEQANADLGRMANELKAKRTSGEIAESDFAKMTEELKQSEAARISKAAEPMPFHDPDMPVRNEQAQEATAAQERIATGQAKAFGEEPSSLSARAQELMSQSKMTPSQAKELQDIKTYLEVLPEMGTAPKDAAAMSPSQAKAFVDAKLPEAPLETFAKVEGSKVLEEVSIELPKPKNDITEAKSKKLSKEWEADYEFYKNKHYEGSVSETIDKLKQNRIDRGLPEEVQPRKFDELSKHQADIEALGNKIERRQQIKKSGLTVVKNDLPPGWKERGVMDPEMAKWIGVTMGGAAIVGYLSDDKAKGAAIGAALVIGGPIALKAIRGMSKAADEAANIGLKKFASLKRDPKIAKQIDTIISAHEGLLATRGLHADRHMYAIKKLVPDATRQEELIRAVQAGNIHTLKLNEQAAAVAHQKFVKEIGERAVAKKLIDSLIDDGTYITGLWKNSDKAKAIFSAVSGNTRHTKQKFIPDYDTGIALGLEPKTRNLGDIDNIYAKAVGRAEANKELLDTLKTVKIEGMSIKPSMTRKENLAAIAKLSNKPNLNAIEQSELTTLTNYKANPHPQLQGVLIHPEMAPSLSHVFYSTNIAPYLMTALAVSAVAKTGLLSYTLFHDKSLLEVAASMALGFGSIKVLTKLPSMYQMIKKGAAGDLAERAVGKGLNISHKGFDMDADMVKKLLNTASTTIDKLPVAGKALSLPTKGLEVIHDINQWQLWEFLHPSAKLSTVSVAMEKANLKYAKILEKDPTAKVPSPDQILQEVVDATNFMYGGINWRKAADSVQNRWLHQQVSSLANPEGQRVLRVALLAPDWATSTIMTGIRGMKATAKGFIPGSKMSVADDMYRRYFLSGSLMSAVIMEGMQQWNTGTHFWDNKDPLSVEWGDGTSTNMFKHFGEILHLMADPIHFSVGKLGYLPSEGMAQIQSKDYFSDKPAPPMEDTSITGRVGHALGHMLPIAAQEIAKGHPGRALSGTLGFPTKGMTRQERMAQRAARAAKRNTPEARELRRKILERNRQRGY